jgi:hypothetical protein
MLGDGTFLATPTGVDTMFEHAEALLSTNMAFALAEKGHRLLPADGVVVDQAFTKSTRGIKGKMAITMKLTDGATGETMEFSLMALVMDLSLPFPMLSWETTRRLGLYVHKEELRHFDRDFKTELLSLDQYDNAERMASIAALEIAERAKRTAQGTVNGMTVETLFEISPTAISN